jgi:uncharacterized membrane protein
VNMNCNNVSIEDIFSMEPCVADDLKYSVFGGIGAIGLLLVVTLVLVTVSCCLAYKLRWIKRYVYS